MTYMVNPKNPEIQGCGLIFFKQAEIYIEDIARLECSYHLEEYIDVSRPFTHDARYRSCAEPLAFPKLRKIGEKISSNCP